jgi:hypothetical protein
MAESADPVGNQKVGGIMKAVLTQILEEAHALNLDQRKVLLKRIRAIKQKAGLQTGDAFSKVKIEGNHWCKLHA